MYESLKVITDQNTVDLYSVDTVSVNTEQSKVFMITFRLHHLHEFVRMTSFKTIIIILRLQKNRARYDLRKFFYQ